MSSLKQNIRTVLADVESFLVETLKGVKLSGSAKDHKDRLLEKIRQLLEEIAGSAGSQQDSNISGGSLKISGGGDSSSGGTSSSNLQSLGAEESGYAGNVPNIAASDLKNKLQTGMLEKKKKSGFKTWEPLYCVVSGNMFYMYRKQGDSKQKEAFCLNGYKVQEATGLEKDASKKEMCFELTQPGAPTYQFRAGSKEGVAIWKEAISKGIQIATDTTEDEPGAYEMPVTYMRAYSESYINIHPLSYGDADEEIYDDLDMPLFPAPPVPRAAIKASSDRYVNLSAPRHTPPAGQGLKTAVRAKPAGGKAHTDPTPEVDFSGQNAREGCIFPSDIKKAKASSGSQAAGSQCQGPPPMINIYKDAPQQNGGPQTPEKQTSVTDARRDSAPAGKTGSTATASSLSSSKSTSANPNKGRDLPAPPTPAKVTGPRSGQDEGKGDQRLPPSPPSSARSVVQSSSRTSPPPQGLGINKLRGMFEN